MELTIRKNVMSDYVNAFTSAMGLLTLSKHPLMDSLA